MAKLDIRIVSVTTWPGKETKQPHYSQFKQTYSNTLQILDYELKKLSFVPGSVQIAMWIDPSNIRLDGQLRANARPFKQGIILSFSRIKGHVRDKATGVVLSNVVEQLSYPCDKYSDWQHNLRAIALSLEALRAVARHGVFKHGDMASRLALPSAEGKLTSAQEAAELLSAFSDFPAGQILGNSEILKKAYRQASAKTHPDQGGSVEKFGAIKEAYLLLEKLEVK